MTQEFVINLIKDKFNQITRVSERNVLRAEYSFNEKIIAVFYIDYEENDIDFDLREYQEDLLVNDYYNKVGDLQWNYYLVFLRNDYIISTKTKIEKNDILSRKFLFKPAEFKEYLDYRKSSSNVKEDVTLKWKDKLDAVELYEVYSNSEYTKAIDRFIKGNFNESKTKSESNFQIDFDKEVIRRLDSVELSDTYRPFPIERNYSFGKVNLINGVNGVGKTSLLEAIEQVICGESQRSGKREKENSIKAVYNDGLVADVYTPSNLEKYRRRDRVWFQNDYKSKNYLSWSFNKYNFYNSDAAYNLHNDPSGESVVRYLTRIAIGSEFGRIQDRLKGFRDRLTPHLNNFSSEIRTCELQIKQAEDTLLVVHEEINPENSFRTLINTSKEYFWLKQLPATIEDDISIYEKNLIQASNIVEGINKLAQSKFLKTIEEFESEYKVIEKKQNLIGLLSKDHKICSTNIVNENLIVNDLSQKSIILEKGNRYFTFIESFEIGSLSERINQIQTKIDNADRILNLYSKRNSNILVNIEGSLGQIRNEKNALLEENTGKLSRMRIQLEEYRKKVGTLQNIVLEIKAKGIQYLLIEKENAECPLCETKFDGYDLLYQKISNAVNELDETKVIGELNENINKIESHSEEIIDLIKQIDLIINVWSQLHENIIDKNITIDQISNAINDLKNDLDINKDQAIALSGKLEKLSSLGFTKVDYLQLKKDFDDNLPFSLVIENKELFEAERNSISDKLKVSNEKLEALNESRIALERKILEIIKVDSFKHDLVDRYIEDLNLSKIEIQQALIYFEQIKDFFEINKNDNINNISLKLENLLALLSSLKTNRLKSTELALAVEIKDKAKKKIVEVSPTLSRIKLAIETIDSILENDTEERLLRDFVEENKREIEEVFLNIHSPREFSEIIFEGKEIFLKKSDETENRSMTMISSGQRSALALSVFLTLNKKLNNGPEVILFDDPVTFTDDLNILSFLDYLRELVINENRQLFFATANKRLAGLFEKKFSFLSEDEFKRFVLERD